MKELESVKTTQRDFQLENRDEFRRIRDKIESLEGQVSKDIKEHAVDIKGLQTELEAKAKIAGTRAGIIAGALTALGSVLLAQFLRTFIGG